MAEQAAEVLDAPETSSPSTDAAGSKPFNAEDYVTEDLRERFSQVFDAHGAGKGEGRTNRSTASARRRSAAAANEELEVDEETVQGLNDDEPGTAYEEREDPGSQTKGKPQPTDGKPAAPETGKEPVDPVPAVLRHAAKRAGWTDAEITEFAEGDLEKALRTFTRLHGSYNDLTNRYAQLGQNRQAPQPTPQPPPSAPATGNGQQTDLLTQLYGDKLTERFAPKYGDDFVKEVLQPLVRPLQEAMQFVQQQQMQAVSQEVGSFFKGQEKDFGEFYGTNGQALKQEQSEARSRLGQLADQVRSGAAMQGIPMTVTEALERAHLVIASELLEQMERRKITDQLTRRSGSITARPTQRHSRQSTGLEGSGERSIQSATEAYAQRATELGLDIGE